jgi:hypothetical protein
VAALADAGGVFRLSGRVLRQHWPVLFALALLGEILRQGAIIGAAYIAYQHESLAFLMFALAPVVYLVAMILMLLRARRSLPELGAPAPRGRLLTSIAAVLVPFLVYYASAGLLGADRDRWVDYSNILIVAHIADNLTIEQAADRIKDNTPTIPVLWVPVVIIVLAALRWLLQRSAFARRHPVLGIPAAYFEVLWLLFATAEVSAFLLQVVLPWARNRRVWAGTDRWVHSGFHFAGVLSGPLRGLVGLWDALWSTASSALFIPVAALLTAAVVYRVQADPTPRPARRPAGGPLQAFGRALVDIPRDAVSSRLGPAVSGSRVMVRAGLTTACVFCLTYVAVTTVPVWLWELERALIGPHSFELWVPLTRYTDRFNSAVTTTLLVCLLAGAIGQLAQRLTPAAASDAETRAAASDAETRAAASDAETRAAASDAETHIVR